MAQQYTVKAGDNLNKIAKQYGYSDYKAAGISGYGSNPDMIQPGQVLTISGGPKVTSVPGIGTLTVKPKGISTTTQPEAVEENDDGLYARTGVTPPPKGTKTNTPAPTTGYQAPSVAGMPNYPKSYNASDASASILDSYNKTLEQITALETSIANSSVASEEERELQRELNRKKAQLDSFDLGTLEAVESQRGQGRGRSLANVALSEGKINRVRALQRLGLAQEADTLTAQLGMAKEDRISQGELSKTQYNMATKKLDLALGIQNTIKGISEDERDNARQYLLDVVDFAEGQTYADLDADTQAAITSAVANSPITLGMVKAALEKGAQADAGELRTVDGLGVVQIVPDGKGGFTYNVIVPESGDAPTGDPSAPTFEEYVTQQGLGQMSLLPSVMQDLRAEYDQTFGNTVSLGKLSATDKSDLSQAGLSNAPSAVKSYFLNTPPAFRDEYQRKYASGAAGTPSLSKVIEEYTKWYEEQNKDSSTRDWSAILNKPAQ